MLSNTDTSGSMKKHIVHCYISYITLHINICHSSRSLIYSDPLFL